MYVSRKSPSAGWIATALIAVSCLCLPQNSLRAEDTATGTPYHSDPEHLWNRLHEAFFVRVAADGREYGRDRLDPLLWTDTGYLTDKKARARAARVLHEFLDRGGEKLFTDPLKRAILQRDLWLVFNWLEKKVGATDPLAQLVASTIDRTALARDQIEALPDFYAAAVASRQFPTRFDPAQLDRAFLPPDLFAADGPWVCVGRPDGPIAPEHLNELGSSNPSTNSVFLVFVRLPLGRAATTEFLQQLRGFDRPLMVEAEPAGNGRRTYVPNPQLPQFPAGTEMALVRRALLIDSTHRVVASKICESVQLRVYREIPEITNENLNAALTGGTAANRKAQSWQSFYEFRLSRPGLFASHAGGLREIGPDERDFKTGFRSHPWDPIDRISADEPLRDADHPVVRQLCFACHSLPGITSFNSYSDDWRSSLSNGKPPRTARLTEITISESISAGVKWREGRPNWIALRELLSK
jgi:hypothetical protein